MPRFYDWIDDNLRSSELTFEPRSPDCVEVFYSLSKESIDFWESMYQDQTEFGSALPEKVKLLEINGRDHLLTMIPINTRITSEHVLRSKYGQVKRITIQDESLVNPDHMPSTQDEVVMLLEELPACFVKDYDYGLGLLGAHRFVIDAIEELSECTELRIVDDDRPIDVVENSTFLMSRRDFEAIRQSNENIARTSRDAARAVKKATTYNSLAEKLGQPLRPVPTGRGSLRRHITNLTLKSDGPLSQNEQDAVLDLVKQNAPSIVRKNAEKLAKLQRDIDLVTLDDLIEKYGDLIEKQGREGRWQEFLNQNSFILSLAFGYPILKIRSQASVGGRKVSGVGDKVADFLVKNRMTNNAAIIEIKRPNTELLGRTEVSRGVYPPHRDLVGAINQALDQKNRFEQEILQFKAKNSLYDVESHAVHCCLIIGKLPNHDDQLRSFELFRGNSKNVQITTFDELLEKLKELREFLNPEEFNPTGHFQEEELPF